MVPVATLPPLLSATDFAARSDGRVESDDPRLEPLLAGASAGIRRYCGWHIGPVVEETIRVDGSGSPVLVLPTLRVEAITDVVEHGREWTPERVAELEWSEAGMVRSPGYSWTDRYRGVTITLRHGFEDVSAVAQIVQQVVANALASPMGATSEQAGSLSVSWGSTAPGVSGGMSLLERDLATLNLYRLPGRS